MNDGEKKHEIIIVRRPSLDDDDGHHGGVWKIAFADFMTAMMCFFLVMWLINAANEQTKAAVASYFNPVKLIDRNSSRKGLEDVGDGPNAVGTQAEIPEAAKSESGNDGPSTSGPSDNEHSVDSSDVKAFSDEHLFADPYAVLAEIAQETGEKQNISTKGDGGAREAGPATGASGGESYRDPFAPDFWQQQVAVPEDSELAEESEAAFEPSPPPEKTAGKSEPEPAKAEEAEAPETVPPAEPKEQAPVAEELAAVKLDPVPEAPEPAPDPAEAAKLEAEQAAAEIGEALGKALDGSPLEDGVTVVPVESGVMISVTDSFADGMFEIGSAVPRRDLVLAMEKIAGVVRARKGAVTINGHTDGRPFRGEGYDNWRLSTARAHAAYYMLVRAGLEEERVRQVAGFADRKLKLPDNPLADANRRIEILVETGG